MKNMKMIQMIVIGTVALAGQIIAQPHVEISRTEWVDENGITHVDVSRTESDPDAPDVSSKAKTTANFWALHGRFPFYVCPGDRTPATGGCETYQPPASVTHICDEWPLKVERAWVDKNCPPTRESNYTYWFGTCGGLSEQVADWPHVDWTGSCSRGWNASNTWFRIIYSPDCRPNNGLRQCCQLADTVTIVTRGTGYRVGDTLYPMYGVACDNQHWKYSLLVTGVNAAGGVLSFTIQSGIGYTQPPPNPVGYWDIPQNGVGFTANVTYR